jgi:kynureninase
VNYQDVLQQDTIDPLAGKRREFVLPDNMIYLDGNSLGAMPIAAYERSRQVTEQQWGLNLIKGWNADDWIDLPTMVGEKIKCNKAAAWWFRRKTTFRLICTLPKV